MLRRRLGTGAALTQIVLVHLVDISRGVGLALPAAQILHRLFCGHVQPEHQVWLRQLQLSVLKIRQPAEKRRLLLPRQLAPLMDGIGGGVPVGQDDPAAPVKLPPILLPGRVTVHGVEGGGRVGVHVAGMGAELSLEIHPQQHGRRFLIPGKHQPVKGLPLRFHTLAQPGKLGGFPRAVGALQHDELSRSLHATSPPLSFQNTALTKKPGSLAMRPMRLGCFARR